MIRFWYITTIATANRTRHYPNSADWSTRYELMTASSAANSITHQHNTPSPDSSNHGGLPGSDPTSQDPQTQHTGITQAPQQCINALHVLSMQLQQRCHMAATELFVWLQHIPAAAFTHTAALAAAGHSALAVTTQTYCATSNPPS